jgi:signal transduction histidine kinase
MVLPRLSRYIVALVCGWTGLLIASAAWNVRRAWTTTQELALSETRAQVEQQRAFNHWAAALGTIYVPATPNELLGFRADRDIQAPSGQPLTLLSPHFMLPHAETTESGAAPAHQRLVSLNPVDPTRDPDAWERSALLAFLQGQREHSDIATLDGKPYLRLLTPLMTEQSCLACHGRQGYRVGDVRGGLEAWTELASYYGAARRESVAICATHGLFWLLGVAGIVLGGRRLARNIAARQRADEQRRHMEAQVLQTQKLESLGVLAGGIAHDFNNLLTGVLGHTSLALEELPPDLPVRRSLEKVQRAANRAADLTRQMLDYAGKGPCTIVALNLNQLITGMNELLATTRAPQAHLAYQLAADLPLVAADAAHLRQVLLNLATNASEALAGKSGSISISTGTLHCAREYLRGGWGYETPPAGPYVFLDVTDTGCGMAAETLPRVFEPFFTTKFTGRGLGLAAVLGIVRRHRGVIKIQSTPGAGTTFRVLFPQVPAAEVAMGSVPPASTRAVAAALAGSDEPEALENPTMSFHKLRAGSVAS